MTSPTLSVEPACPEATAFPTSAPSGSPDDRTPSTTPSHGSRALRAVRRPLDAIDPATWDALAARAPWATPFSQWAFHRAWWDAYGANAHEQTLVVVADDAPSDAPPVAIVPLMHRHEVEPGDAVTSTHMRADSSEELTPVPPQAKAVFMGASYHADYATLLADPADLPAVAEALTTYLAAPSDDAEHPEPWDVVDLRRLRCGDPAADALAASFGAREIECSWTLNVEREDVCPVAILPADASLDDYLSTLGKKVRHEIRRKVRRAEAAGETRLEISGRPLDDLDAFIDLHQRRWGDQGLFPDTVGGAQSRVFFRRLFETFGPDGPLRLAFLTVGDRRIAAGVHFDDGESFYYYNAGVDPDARDLSPGVVLIARYLELALALGRRRMDFLRGDESYKYEWGAADEPIQRLLVRRTGS
jgi:CelD/BcsL family acetyltransferase involved in cellulose biosynthesis